MKTQEKKPAGFAIKNGGLYLKADYFGGEFILMVANGLSPRTINFGRAVFVSIDDVIRWYEREEPSGAWVAKTLRAMKEKFEGLKKPGENRSEKRVQIAE